MKAILFLCGVILFFAQNAAATKLTFSSTGSVYFADEPVKNLPVRIYFTGFGAQDDTVIDNSDGQLRFDKTGFSDSTGSFSITFPDVASKYMPAVVMVGQGTKMQNECTLNLTISGQEMAVNLDELESYTGINIVGVIKDSVKVLGKITQADTSKPVPFANVKVYLGGGVGTDTLFDTTGQDGLFSFPQRLNINLSRTVYVWATARGFTGKNAVPFNIAGNLWDGKSDTARISMSLDSSGTIIPDTVDTFIVIGTVKDTAAQAIAGAMCIVSFGSSSSALAVFGSDTTGSDGKYELKIPNTGSFSNVFYKVNVSAAGFLSSETSGNTGIAPKDGKNDTAVVDFSVRRNAVVSSGDTMVFLGTVLDSASGDSLSGALVQLSIGADSAATTILGIDTTDKSGRFSFVFVNTEKRETIYYKYLSGGEKFVLTSGNGNSVLAPQDGKVDTVWVNFRIVKAKSQGDTLFVCGKVTDSLNNILPVYNASVKIGLGVDGIVFPVTVQLTTDTNGVFCYKVFNSVKATRVFGKIEVTKSGYLASITTADLGVLPDDFNGDSLKVNIRIKPIASGTALPQASAAVIDKPVTARVYTLSGRLVAKIESHENSFSGDFEKTVRALGLARSALVVCKQEQGKKLVMRRILIK